MKFVSQSDLSSWLDKLAADSNLIAPRMVEEVLLYRPVEDHHPITWDYIRPVMSIKDAFFPSTERLLTIEKTQESIKMTEYTPDGQTVLFGVRPCDARGMLALDALFIDTEPVDPYYAQRRKNTTIIGMVCQEMGESCFCTSVGGAPDDTTGMDVMLSEANGGYTVEVLTEKGQELVSSLPLEEISGKKPLLTHGQLVPIPAHESWPRHFNDEYWVEMSERCLSCRICAYVCPTCRCFDVRDESVPSDNGYETYERIRCWDSCAGEAYRRIAGGHNPRAAKGERLRNRFFCKFYYYPEQYGPTACTGCGRCVDSCPVNIDITEILPHLVEVTP